MATKKTATIKRVAKILKDAYDPVPQELFPTAAQMREKTKRGQLDTVEDLITMAARGGQFQVSAFDQKRELDVDTVKTLKSKGYKVVQQQAYKNPDGDSCWRIDISWAP